MNKTTKQTSAEALAEFLELPTDEVEACQKMIDDGDYLVLSDEDAEETAKEYIRQSVWAFNKSFLDAHSEAISEMDEKSFAKLQEGCESVNKAIWCMIDDKEHFLDDAIKCDGRGHFLSGYDGAEEMQGEYYIYRCN